MKMILYIFCVLSFLSCKSTDGENYGHLKGPVSENNENQKEIPQGKFKYEIYFAEFGGRMKNGTCNVEINQNHIVVTQDETTGLTGGKVIFDGMILKHKSGKWILAEKKENVNAVEIGGCTEIPIIYFDKKLIEWC